MAAVELATAYVSIVPSAKGMAANLVSELGAPMEQAATKAGSAASSKFAGTFTKGLGGLQGALTAALPAAGVAAGIAGLGTAAYNLGASFDDAYDKIRTGTGATGAALDGLKDDFRNVVTSVPTDFDKASTAIASITNKLGLTGPALDGVSSQFLELSRITKTDLTGNLDAGTDALNNWGVAAANQPGVLDELFRASQASGVSFADLSKQLSDNGPVLRDVGINIDQATGFLATLGKAGVDVSDVMPALSKSLATAAKEGKPAGDVFRDTFAAILSAPDDVTAAGDALGVFGAKAGPKLAGLIREGKLSYDEMVASITGGSDTILGASKDTQDFSEKWELFKNKVMVKLEPIVVGVFNALSAGIDDLPALMAAAQPLFDAFSEFASVLQTALAPAIDFINDHWDQLKIALIAVAVPLAAAAAVMTGVMLVGLGTITVAITLAVAAVAGLVTGLQFLWDKSEGIRNTIIPPLVTAFETVASVVSTTAGIAVQAFDDLRTAFETAWRLASAAWDSVGAPIFDGIKTAVDNVTGWFDGLVWFVAGLPGRMAAATTGLWNWISEGFKAAVNIVVGLFNHLIDLVNDFQVHIHIDPPGPGSIDFDWNGLGIPRIPEFASGGLVPGTGPQLAIVHGGEYITPAMQVGRALGSDDGTMPTRGFAHNGDVYLVSSGDVARDLRDVTDEYRVRAYLGQAS